MSRHPHPPLPPALPPSRAARRGAGVTLLEILLAFSLLVFSFVVLITAFQGAGKETTFTSEHYTAMFLAQKVLEDINQRVAENPHFFTSLINDAEGEAVPVTGGRSKYFRLLENTRNFNRLLPTEDEPIVRGDLFEQLKPFQVKVSTRFKPDPVTGQTLRNLIWINIAISWTSKEGLAKEYVISQLLQGTSDELFKEEPSVVLSPAAQAALDRKSVAMLARLMASDVPALANAQPGQFTVADLVRASPGAQDDAVLQIARMVGLIDGSIAQDEALTSVIEPLEQVRDQVRGTLQKSDKNALDRENCLKFVDYQKRIAELYQQKAVLHVSNLMLLRTLLPKLAVIFADPTVLGTKLSLCCPILSAILDDSSEMASLAAMSFGTAEKCYLSLINPPILAVLPRRKEPELVRRILDIQKIGVLKEPKSGDAEKLRNALVQNIGLFHKKYLGTHPNFTDFLDEEKRLSRSLKDLQAAYAGVEKVFGFLLDLPDEVMKIEKSVPAPFNGR